MAHEIETMMYDSAHGKPWHDEGVEFDGIPSTVDNALAVAGMDWKVEKQQLQLANGKLAPRWATVRSSDGAILGTVTDDYTVLDNAPAFAPLQPMLDAGLATVATVMSLRGGARVCMTLRIGTPDAVIVPGSDDRVEKYVLAATGHDGTLAAYYGTTGIRVVCANTLSQAIGRDGGAMLRLRHSSNINDAIKNAADFIAACDARLESAATVYRALAAVPCTSERLKTYVDAVFPAPKSKAPIAVQESDILATLLARPIGRPSVTMSDTGNMTDETSRRIHGEICDLFEGKGKGSTLVGSRGTAWGAYNAVTEYITHHRGRSADSRANNVLLGDIGARAIRSAQSVFLGA